VIQHRRLNRKGSIIGSGWLLGALGAAGPASLISWILAAALLTLLPWCTPNSARRTRWPGDAAVSARPGLGGFASR
jgi:hypothetical protein